MPDGEVEWSSARARDRGAGETQEVREEREGEAEKMAHRLGWVLKKKWLLLLLAFGLTDDWTDGRWSTASMGGELVGWCGVCTGDTRDL